MIGKILGLFVNLLTADKNYSLLNKRHFCNIFRYNIFRHNYLKNEKNFLLFFLFRNLNLILDISKIKMTLIAEIFLNLESPENVVR